jgi:hypothetical protein
MRGIVKRKFTEEEQDERDTAAIRRKWTNKQEAALHMRGNLQNI